MFNYIALIISFFKSKGSLILNYAIGFAIIALLIANAVLNSKLKTCKAENTLMQQELKHAKEIQELKALYANKTIAKNIVEYKDKIVYIDRIKADETKNSCNNAIALLRANF